MTSLAQTFGLPVPPILNASDPRNMCTIGGIIGEHVDTACSPNDPIFHFFHADIDRNWYNWQIDHMDLGIYGEYPETGFCPGHGLNDALLGASGPTPSQVDLGPETTPMTIKQLIERTLPPEFGTPEIAPWSYQPFSLWSLTPTPVSYLPPFSESTYCNGSSVVSHSFLLAIFFYSCYWF